MTATERRIRALEKEVAKLKAGCDECRPSYYDIAKERCKGHWELVKKPCMGIGPYNECMAIARTAFKDKRGCCYCGTQPREYIASMEDVEEFFSLFKRFLAVYLQYQSEGGRERW